MSFVARGYEDIVRDLLTTLTGGTVREELDVPLDPEVLELPRLAELPVRRVSHLEGVVTTPAGQDIPYRFGPADFELLPAEAGERIRFRPEGRRPKPGSKLLVNYYPLDVPAAPVDDISVGSVVRTLLETVARELALGYQQLDQVYQAAFLETAAGKALDKVVALVGVRRLPAGHPQVRVRFSRRADSLGRVTVPQGTVVLDAEGARYLTAAELSLEPGESARNVLAVGERTSTAVVDAGALDRLETLVAGVAGVTNPEPARQSAAAETDEALRRRARGALQGRLRGTVAAIEFGVRSVPGVKDAEVVEEPHGVPGEIAVQVVYEGGSEDPAVRAEVERQIELLRPAGIRLASIDAAEPLAVTLQVGLELAGSGVEAAELNQLTNAAEQRLRAALDAVAAGKKVRWAQLLARTLEDARIVGAELVIVELDTEQAHDRDFVLPAGRVLAVEEVEFLPPASEDGGPVETVLEVSLSLPLHLIAGATLAQVRTSVSAKLDAYLAQRGPEQALTGQGLLDAVADPALYGAVREEATITVERAGDTFLQLSDAAGSYAPEPGEVLRRPGDEGLLLELREGSL